MLSILWYVLGPALSPPYALLQKNNQSPSNRVATESLIPTPFPPSKLCCAPGLFPFVPSGSLARAIQSVAKRRSGQYCGKRQVEAPPLRPRLWTMAVGAKFEFKIMDIFLLLSKEGMSGFQGCCPRLCVDKMAPWPSSAPSIMAGCCREGEIKRCCWGWGAAGSVFFFFPELSCLFPNFLFLLSHRTDWSLAYSLVSGLYWISLKLGHLCSQWRGLGKREKGSGVVSEKVLGQKGGACKGSNAKREQSRSDHFAWAQWDNSNRKFSISVASAQTLVYSLVSS